MSDVFISYSRKDGEFAHRLVDALEKAGRDSWVDWEGIPYSADWMLEIEAGIDEANSFVFIISPNSLCSRVCNLEVEYARANQKRIIPILYHSPEGVNQKLLPEVIHTWYGEDWQST